MRPTFMSFETAKKAIFVNQKSIDIMGNNIANIGTEGYTRQRVDRAAVSAYSGSSRVASSRVALAGQGVDAMGVSQTRDTFLDKRFREEYSKASYHGQAGGILSDIQLALVDGEKLSDSAGLSGAIQDIYKSLNDFVKAPTLGTQANLVMSSFKNLTQLLKQIDSNLVQLSDRHSEDLGVDTARVNEIASQIAHLNKVISEDSTVLSDPSNEYFRPNELMDQRNLLLDELASYGDITTSEKSDGKVNVSFGGHPLVDGNEFDELSVTKNSDNTVSINWRSTAGALQLSTGSIQASQHFINGRGNNVQSATEEPYKGIPYYRDQMNTFASTFAKMANSTLPVYDATTNKPAVDANGDIIYRTLLGAKNPDGTYSTDNITASNISLSKEWTTNGADYFIYNKNEAIEDYAQQLAANLTDNKFTFKSHGETYEGTFANFNVSIIGNLGTDIKFHTGRQDSFAMTANDFLDRRDSISGVNQDEETADMMKFQKSYEAASRFMTVLDDLLDTIINRTGRAGL